MKKNVLSLSIAKMMGGLALPEATRVHGGQTVIRVTDAGVGHALVPYYNAQCGNLSVFHVSNSESVRLKPVRVRPLGENE